MNSKLRKALIKISLANNCSDFVAMSDEAVVEATDYAKMNNVETENNGQVKTWTAPAGQTAEPKRHTFDRTVLPEICVDLNYIDELGENKCYLVNGEPRIVFEYLKYPRRKLSEDTCATLSELKDRDSYRINGTSIHYFGHTNSKDKMICNRVYIVDGQRYVYVQNDNKGGSPTTKFSDGTRVSEPKDAWFAVSPIEWKIVNWDNLPKYINPNGDGSETFLRLVPSGAMFGVLPFGKKRGQKNDEYYQNSFPRAYLNDYNIHSEIENGNGLISLRSGSNFDLAQHRGISFIEEIFDDLFIYSAKFPGQETDISGRSGVEILNIPQARQAIMAGNIPPTVVPASTQQTQSQPTQSQQTQSQSQPVQTGASTKSKKATTSTSTATKDMSAKQTTVEEGGRTMAKGPTPPATNPFGVTVEREPMKLKDQLSFYIETGTSFMLHGPSGVGKTRRVKELDPNLVALTLRDGILPEEVIGKTIYRDAQSYIDANGDTVVIEGGSFWEPPPWYKQICEICEREPDKNHVLFIDELSNVRPYEQSLVYHIVLEHSIDHNRGILPPNCIVVAAGNELSDSEAAHALAEPLFRRFSAHIYLDVNVADWLEWGSERQPDHPERQKIHPLVQAYIASHGKLALQSKYDPDKPPKNKTELPVDPRSWEQVSDIIYENGGVLRKELIENKVGPTHAEGLIQLAENPPRITLESVVSGNYKESDIPKGMNERYYLALSLRRANIDQVEVVREFIGKYLGGENLAIFDSLWIEDDEERAMKIAELTGELDEEGILLDDEEDLSDESEFVDE